MTNAELAARLREARYDNRAITDALLTEAAAALEAAQPEGWVLVPREPTDDMVEAGGSCKPFMQNWTPGQITAAAIYRAMLSAARDSKQ